MPIANIISDVLKMWMGAGEKTKEDMLRKHKDLQFNDITPVSTQGTIEGPGGAIAPPAGAGAGALPLGGEVGGAIPLPGAGGAPPAGGALPLGGGAVGPAPNQAIGGGFDLGLGEPGMENRGADGGFSITPTPKKSAFQSSVETGSKKGEAPSGEKMGAWDKAAIAASVASGLLNKSGPPLPNVGGFTPGQSVSDRFVV